MTDAELKSFEEFLTASDVCETSDARKMALLIRSFRFWGFQCLEEIKRLQVVCAPKDPLLTFRRWNYEVYGKPGLLHLDPNKVVSVTEEARPSDPMHFDSPRISIGLIAVEAGGSVFHYEVLDEERTVAQQISEARY